MDVIAELVVYSDIGVILHWVDVRSPGFSLAAGSDSPWAVPSTSVAPSVVLWREAPVASAPISLRSDWELAAWSSPKASVAVVM